MKRHRKKSLQITGIVFVAAWVVTVTSATFAQNRQRIETQTPEYSQGVILGSPLKYLLYLPKDLNDSKMTELPKVKTPNEKEAIQQWPLVLFLHGGGEGGDDINLVKKHGLPKLIAAGRDFPFFVVSPQNPNETQFWDDQRLMQLLNEIKSTHPIDPKRVYLTGMSRGGYGAWRLAIQNPDHFAAVVPVCGGGALPYVKRLKSVPIWVFHGAKDPVIPLEESQRLVQELKRVGGNVKFTIYPEADHDAWTETYDSPDLYSWLMEQKIR